jgi:hypothetical protein
MATLSAVRNAATEVVAKPALPYGEMRQQRCAALRAQRLYAELSFALSRVDRPVLTDWGLRSATRLLTLSSARVGGVVRLLRVLGEAGANEAVGLFRAARDGELLSHAGARTAAAIDEVLAVGQDGWRAIFHGVRLLRDDPASNAPIVLAAVLGCLAGSGGVDGDGGVPDLDLLFGIGAHRSVLTHSLVAGVVLEGLALAVIDLASAVHERLPFERDPLWDSLARAGGAVATGLTTGALAGVAYHLLVDAWLQPAALHDLPAAELPIEGHQFVVGVSGAAEAVRTGQRLRFDVPRVIDQPGEEVLSVGRACVEACCDVVAAGGAAVGDALRLVLKRFGR